jgi:hypothetical protein
LKVLEVLSEAGLHLKPEKYKFDQQEVKYLGFIISTSRTKMDPVSYPTFKTHFKNGDSYQVMTQAIGQELLLTTLHPLPTGSRIMGGQEKRVRQPWLGNMRGDSFQSTTGSTQSTLNGDITGDTPGQQ